MVHTRQTFPRKHPLRRLRDHPKVHCPPGMEPNPPWAGPGAEFPDLRRVVLASVELVRADAHAPAHLTLAGNYNGNLYRTTLTLADTALLPNLCVTLGKCVGGTIADVGSVGVDGSHSLA